MSDYLFHTTDIIIVGVLLLSGLLAYFRGLTHELLAIGKWIGAFLAAFYGFEHLQPVLKKLVGHQLTADIATSIILFVGTLVLLAYISHRLCDKLHDTAVGMVDKSLGFLFGLARGAAIVCIAFLVLTWASDNAEPPIYFQQTKSLPLVKDGAKLIASLLNIESVLEAEKKEKEQDKPQTDEKSSKTPEKPSDKETEKGYKDDAREDLDELIENTQ